MRAIESGLVPDSIPRLGIRHVCVRRLIEQVGKDGLRSDHVRALLERVGRWMTREGELFLHAIAHRRHAHPHLLRGAAS